MTAQPFAARALGDVAFRPFWLDSPDAPEPTPPLSAAAETDLLIVGGGFTGLWAAVLAKEAQPDREVMLIEAGAVANGASGRPGAIVSTSLMHGLANAARIFPDDIETLERLGRENMRDFLAALERHGIDAEQHWGGEMHVAVGPHGLADVREEYELFRRYGHEVELLDAPATRAQLDSPLFQGAVHHTTLSGTLHPARLVWGLRRAAISLGVRLFERTPLLRLSRSGGAIRVETPQVAIRARKVLLATNGFAVGDRRIARRVMCVRDRILVTEPLTAEQRARIGWARGQGVYDTRTQLNYMRLTPDGRILFGGRLAYFYNGHRNTDPDGDRRPDPYVRLAEAFARTFPQLDDLRFTHAWSGPIGMTTRMAVHFQTYHEGDAVYAGGYSGFGVSTSRFGARIGLAKLDGEDLPELKLDFARTVPNWIPPEPFRWIGAQITLHALDTADEKGGWRRPWLDFVHRLGFPL